MWIVSRSTRKTCVSGEATRSMRLPMPGNTHSVSDTGHARSANGGCAGVFLPRVALSSRFRCTFVSVSDTGRVPRRPVPCGRGSGRLVAEVAAAGQDHRFPGLLDGGYDLRVTARAARLAARREARAEGELRGVRERGERVSGADRAL